MLNNSLISILNRILFFVGFKLIKIPKVITITEVKTPITSFVRSEIKKQGLRQDWIAEKLNISTSYLSRLISGERKNEEKLNSLISLLKSKSVNDKAA
ncbi:MAG: helix-turn-helix transcriptional regulator [Ignavibacterium sp.]|nr:helix-turn-helix transcriptional regulator [Ignavibacterium sp.]